MSTKRIERELAAFEDFNQAAGAIAPVPWLPPTGDQWKERQGLSCGHWWNGYAWTRCPRCGDVATEEVAATASALSQQGTEESSLLHKQERDT